MNSNFYTYQMGQTLITVGLSQTVQVNCQNMRGVNGGFFKINSGGGTLAIVNGASNITSQGYLVGTTEVVKFVGPANFFLAASGATMVVGLVTSLTAGFSAPPVG